MADAGSGPPTGGSPFKSVDSKLTIYALANGMDLEKEASSRRLTWFREGRDRGILLEVAADGALSMTAMSWKTRHEADAERRLVVERIEQADLADRLSALLEEGLEAANAL